MKVGILGTGDVGQALGRAFVALGHQAMMGSRHADNPKALAWAKQAGDKAHVGTFAQAIDFAELVVLATLGVATEALLQEAGPDKLSGKVVIDATNPLEHSSGTVRLAIGHTDSLGERIQRLAPAAGVVKAFNTVGNALMFRPSFAGGPPDMFVCGNDAKAKEAVSRILSDFGWGMVDIGDITGCRYLEPMCLVWVRAGVTSGSWKHAFKLLRQ